MRGPTPKYAKMPRSGRVLIDARRLQSWRNARGMTRQQLADASRISVHSIKDYERGLHNPHDKPFVRLCRALGIEPAELLFDDCRYIHPTPEEED